MSILEHIELTLRKAIDKARSEGWTITRGVTRDVHGKRCCPLGALCGSTDDYPFADAKRILGIHYVQVLSIVRGYEGRPLDTVLAANRAYYDLGRRLWAYAEATR